MDTPSDKRDFRTLAMCGLAMIGCAGAMSALSIRFAYGTDVAQRPILFFIALMTTMFVIHLVGLRAAKRTCNTQQMGFTVVFIWAVAVISRVLLLPSYPIQEIDLYRYIWDGEVAAAGVSPFEYAPEEVIAALDTGPKPAFDSQGSTPTSNLDVLTGLCEHQAGTDQVLRRIHFAELPTVYPLVSQVVFAAVAFVTPESASVSVHVLVMKAAIVLFDLLTIASMSWLLNLSRLSPAYVIAYAWNPLVLKEFAGSGHLDSIAVFFAVTAVAFLVRAQSRCHEHPVRVSLWIMPSALLAAGFGAKLFPVVLLPLFLAFAFRSSATWRIGLARVVTMAFAFVAIASLCVVPLMLPRAVAESESGENSLTTAPSESFTPPVPSETGVNPGTSTTDGFKAFFSSWQMNDVIFSVLLENVRYRDGSRADAWYGVTPSRFRRWVSQRASDVFACDPRQASFLVARIITAFIFALIVLWSVLRIDAADVRQLGQLSFLTLAWFWALSPTLNPWYWTWALPLLPLTKSRGWWLISGLLTLYYLRFWLDYHPEMGGRVAAAFGLPPSASGTTLFDEILVFVEHLPWMAIVLWESISRVIYAKSARFDDTARS